MKINKVHPHPAVHPPCHAERFLVSIIFVHFSIVTKHPSAKHLRIRADEIIVYHNQRKDNNDKQKWNRDFQQHFSAK